MSISNCCLSVPPRDGYIFRSEEQDSRQISPRKSLRRTGLGIPYFPPPCPSHTFVYYRLLLFSSLAAGQTLYLYSHRGEETEGSERVGGQKTGVFRVMFTAIIQKGTPQSPHSSPPFLGHYIIERKNWISADTKTPCRPQMGKSK